MGILLSFLYIRTDGFRAAPGAIQFAQRAGMGYKITES